MASVLLTNQQLSNGAVVYTDFQSEGKGQRGNSWESDKAKNILISIILNTKFVAPPDFFNLTILTSLAIHDLLSEYIKEDLKIKWPNDLIYQDKKIAGILIENYIRQNIIEWCIVGVGINVNQLNFKEKKAISLTEICSQVFDREELINFLLQKIEGRYFQLQKGNLQILKNEYLSKLYWKDEIHVFRSEGAFFNGKIRDVAPSGKLIMEIEDGIKSFDFKEITFIK